MERADFDYPLSVLTRYVGMVRLCLSSSPPLRSHRPSPPPLLLLLRLILGVHEGDSGGTGQLIDYGR